MVLEHSLMYSVQAIGRLSGVDRLCHGMRLILSNYHPSLWHQARWSRAPDVQLHNRTSAVGDYRQCSVSGQYSRYFLKNKTTTTTLCMRNIIYMYVCTAPLQPMFTHQICICTAYFHDCLLVWSLCTSIVQYFIYCMYVHICYVCTHVHTACCRQCTACHLC